MLLAGDIDSPFCVCVCVCACVCFVLQDATGGILVWQFINHKHRI